MSASWGQEILKKPATQKLHERINGPLRNVSWLDFSEVPTHHGIPLLAPEVDLGVEDYDRSFYDFLATVEEGNFWFENRNSLIVHTMRRFFPQAQRFLEVGSGTGFVLSAIAREFPHLEVCATEVQIEGLSWVRKRVPQATLFQSDATSLTLSEVFDIIGLFDVLEHIEADEQALRCLAAALRPGGGLILTVPQHQALWSQVDEISGHKRRYEAAELVSKLERAGLRSIFATSFVSLLSPILWLSRYTQRNKDPRTVFEDQFRLSPWLNKVLLQILSLERSLIERGARFPVGGSRLVVAVKA